MFNLDISSIRLCAVVVITVTLVSLSAFWRFKNFKANAGWWSAGIIVYCLAFIGVLWASQIPSPILDVLVETALVTSGMLFLNAVRVKLHKPPLLNFTVALVLVTMANSAFFFYVVPNALVRQKTVFMVTALLTLSIVWEICAMPTASASKPTWPVPGCFCLMAYSTWPAFAILSLRMRQA
jgi:hypothetical protein